MGNEINSLRSFGKFRLDAEKKVLWFENNPVNLTLKETELLCVLTENSGEVITKDELLTRVWADSFVEESNLSRHIYRLRKTFEEFGESADLIQTVPRRGYRFTGEIHENGTEELIIEKHSISRTLVEELETSAEPNAKIVPTQISQPNPKRLLLPLVIGLFLLTTAFGFYFYNSAKPAANRPIRSLAVLPVKSHSAKADDEELRWQITDALITKLGGLKEISVRPTASVLRFAKADESIFEIGKKLEVEAVLDSRIQQEGETIRVTLQLINVENGEQLWSDIFDGNVNQLLNLQDKISARVLQSLNQNRRQNLELTQRPTQNDDAYTAYLKGRYFARRSDEKSLRKGIDFYQQAIKLDSEFSDAFASLADAQYRLFNGRYDISAENVAEAKTNLQKALSLKPDSINALLTLGFIQYGYDLDWKKSEETWKKAIEIAPQLSALRMRYGMFLLCLRRFEEAQAEIEKAIQFDPTYSANYSHLATIYYCKKDYAKAEELFKKSLELDENWVFAHWHLSRTLWMQERKAESLKYVVSGLKIEGNHSLAQLIEEKLQTQTPEDITRFLIGEWTKNAAVQNALPIATRAILIGDRETALTYLEKSFIEPGPKPTNITSFPEFESLNDEPRFKALVQKLNL